MFNKEDVQNEKNSDASSSVPSSCQYMRGTSLKVMYSEAAGVAAMVQVAVGRERKAAGEETAGVEGKFLSLIL